MPTIEKKHGVHSDERYDVKAKNTADAYAEAKELDFSMCANDYVIDVNKRGKSKDITESGKFELDEPALSEK